MPPFPGLIEVKTNDVLANKKTQVISLIGRCFLPCPTVYQYTNCDVTLTRTVMVIAPDSLVHAMSVCAWSSIDGDDVDSLVHAMLVCAWSSADGNHVDSLVHAMSVCAWSSIDGDDVDSLVHAMLVCAWSSIDGDDVDSLVHAMLVCALSRTSSATWQSDYIP